MASAFDDLGPWKGEIIYICRNPRRQLWLGLQSVHYSAMNGKDRLPDDRRQPFSESMEECPCPGCREEAAFQLRHYFGYEL